MVIKEITIEYFEEHIYDKYINLFSKDEQRDWNTIKCAYQDKIEKFYAIYVDNIEVGFFMLEKLNDYPYYLDYFSIYNEYQGKKYGSEAIQKLLSDIVKEDGLIGEIEDVTFQDLTTIRRWKFYEKIGFKKNSDVNFFFCNNIFNLIIYPRDYNIEEGRIAEILLDYYKYNIGEEETKKLCKIMKK